MFADVVMDHENKIELSVVIPCWNVAAWLPRCLDEVFAALPNNAQVIAVNDGSTDSTGAILKKYAKTYPQLQVIEQENLGVSAARNCALRACKGEYIFFVDPDDGVEVEFFLAMLERIKCRNADYCVTSFRYRLPDGGFKDEKLKSEYEYSTNEAILEGYVSRIFGYSFNDVHRMNKGQPLFAVREMASVWRAVFKRSIIEEHNIRFDETIELYEDAIFNAEYLLYAQKMTCIDRPLYRVTSRSSGAMNTVPRDGLRLCNNKLRLLEARKRLNGMSGGSLWQYCEASCTFSALEILSNIVKHNLPFAKGRAILRQYICDEKVRHSIRKFPISIRKPMYALSVLFLRLRLVWHN